MAEQNQQELNKKQEELIIQKKKDYLSTFSSEAGKKVLADLENLCYVNKTTFSEIKGRTLLNEGMRFVVVHIKNMMKMNIERLKELIQNEEE